MIKEVFTYLQMWDIHNPPQEQAISQTFAEERFNWLLEGIKQPGVDVSPVKRTMRILQNAEGQDWMMIYDQKVWVKTPDAELMETLKHQFEGQ